MKHLILPIASSPYEGAHQSAIIVPPPSPELPEYIEVDGVMLPVRGWVWFNDALWERQ